MPPVPLRRPLPLLLFLRHPQAPQRPRLRAHSRPLQVPGLHLRQEASTSSSRPSASTPSTASSTSTIPTPPASRPPSTSPSPAPPPTNPTYVTNAAAASNTYVTGLKPRRPTSTSSTRPSPPTCQRRRQILRHRLHHLRRLGRGVPQQVRRALLQSRAEGRQSQRRRRLGGPQPSTARRLLSFMHHVAAVICRENSRMICSATRMRPAGSRVVARGRSPGECA
eukprot:scaffold8141_cov100-Isochrysis_galbana.AAC.2